MVHRAKYCLKGPGEQQQVLTLGLRVYGIGGSSVASLGNTLICTLCTRL